MLAPSSGRCIYPVTPTLKIRSPDWLKLYLSTEFPNYAFSSWVRDLLGIILDQELSFAPQLHCLTLSCFYPLHVRQLRTVSRNMSRTLSRCLALSRTRTISCTVSRSMSTGAAVALVHSFVTNRLDYNSLYPSISGSPSVRLACLLYCIVMYSSIYIAPLNSHRQTEALLVRLAPRKDTSIKK